MAQEIERKYLVTGSVWRATGAGVLIKQGYLVADKDRQVRVRVRQSQAFLTVKSKPVGITRSEFEYSIPLEDGNEMLQHLCIKPILEKTRYSVIHANALWEVDEFHGDNKGLLIAEIELSSDAEQIVLPDWIGKEVSTDSRYSNANLVRVPYCRW